MDRYPITKTWAFTPTQSFPAVSLKRKCASSADSRRTERGPPRRQAALPRFRPLLPYSPDHAPKTRLIVITACNARSRSQGGGGLLVTPSVALLASALGERT